MTHKSEDYKISAVNAGSHKNVEKTINKVKPENYFEYAYNLKEEYELKMKSSTKQRKIKIYKV